MATHDVLNQPPPLVDYDLFSSDRALTEAVRYQGAGWAEADLAALGTTLGRAETIEWGVQANRNPPELRAFDRYGNRHDKVEFHPAWHELMALGVAAGLHAAPWADAEARRPCRARRRCHDAGPGRERRPMPDHHDLRRGPGAAPPSGDRCGMAAADLLSALRQELPAGGGKDRRAHRHGDDREAGRLGFARQHDARGADGADGSYRLTGHKWFMSAPMCDAFLTLAQAPGGLSCFFLPRWTPDGALNAIRLQRLKDKLGNRSNASSEIELDGAWARLVGDEGRGIPTIIEMGNYTRLDCALGSAGLMRQAVAQAIHHAGHRTAFQKRLADQPLMTNVLADLALESEAATALALRLARAYDNESDPAEAAFRRIVTPAAKYWICKRGVVLTAEAMEVLGGNGYVEESLMPRLYREAPVNSIWEGSGNIMCLDVLRALGRSGAAEAVLAELRAARGGNADLDRHIARLESDLAKSSDESAARRLVEAIVLALQAALLLRHAPNFVADAFCTSRLGDNWGHAFGTLPAAASHEIVSRASPAVS